MSIENCPQSADPKRLASSTASLAGVVSFGLGLAAPAMAAPPPPTPICTLGYATAGNCALDVNGGGYDLYVTSSTYGQLSQFPGADTISFLVSGTVGGKSALLKLSAGDSVDAGDFVPGSFSSYGVAYWTGLTGYGWDAVGATGYAGFRIAAAGGGYNYGWLDLEHGSLIVNSFGYNATLNAAAVIPGGVAAVPEASSLALMAVGAAGILALRRRRNAAAQSLAH